MSGRCLLTAFGAELAGMHERRNVADRDESDDGLAAYRQGPLGNRPRPLSSTAEKYRRSRQTEPSSSRGSKASISHTWTGLAASTTLRFNLR